ncbi:hypothetical protein CBR_g29438 [Chara braunii]|uniref:Translation initiation factor IF-3 n=1 Tax=Chara braunii TaxID=69332 RepID=A0A388LAG2_CHABU|nr:hypothetical protein CBR_g29438 [Chara braunii]|eukprot:GBG79288.1 hypothetical protein CBR_g29438 [Chara braunii]
MGRICLEPWWRRAWGPSARRNSGSAASTGRICLEPWRRAWGLSARRYCVIDSAQDRGPERGGVYSGWGEHLPRSGTCQDCNTANAAREDSAALLPKSVLQLTATINLSPVAEGGTHRENAVESLLRLPLHGSDAKPSGLPSIGAVSHPREAQQGPKTGWGNEGMLPEGQRRWSHPRVQWSSSSCGSSVASFTSLRLRLKFPHAFTENISPPLSQFGSTGFDNGSRGIFERCTIARGMLGSCAQNFLAPFVASSSSHCSFPKGMAPSSTFFGGLASVQNILTPFVASSTHCAFPKGLALPSTWLRGLAAPSKLPSRSAERGPTSTASEKQQQASDNDKAKEGPRINFEIKAPLVRLVGTDKDGNVCHEVVTRAAALMKSRQAGLDLVEINPSSDPPVCKILDYTKYRYELKKKEKDARKRQLEKRRVDVVKNVQIGSRTEQRDLELKVKQAAAHLLQGHRVKLLLIFRSGDRGRGVGTGTLEQALGMLEDVGIVEVVPKDIGQHAMAILRPKAAAAAPGSSAGSS